jgi:hypothetical protein
VKVWTSGDGGGGERGGRRGREWEFTCVQYLLFSTIVKIAIASHRTLSDAPDASDGGAQHVHACGSRSFVAGPTSRKEGCLRVEMR